MKSLSILVLVMFFSASSYADFCSADNEYLIKINSEDSLNLVKRVEGQESATLNKRSEGDYFGQVGLLNPDIYKFSFDEDGSLGHLSVAHEPPPRQSRVDYYKTVDMKPCNLNQSSLNQKVMQMKYFGETTVDLNNPNCVSSYVKTYMYSGEFSFDFFLGWFSQEIGAAAESCNQNNCSLTSHGVKIDISVEDLSGKVAVTYCDYE